MSFYGILGLHIQEAIQGNHYFVSGINSCFFAFTAHSEANKRILLRFPPLCAPACEISLRLKPVQQESSLSAAFFNGTCSKTEANGFFSTEVCKINLSVFFYYLNVEIKRRSI